MTDFGKAGIKKETYGTANQFHRTLQIPWVYVFTYEPDLISLIRDITDEFVDMESLSMGGIHRARIIAHKTHTALDIEISADKIRVYPTTQGDHQNTSEILYKILQNYRGALE
jgi:hypothetical protein